MLLIFLIIVIAISLIFIFKSEDEQYLSKLSLLVFGLSVIINFSLLNDGLLI